MPPSGVAIAGAATFVALGVLSIGDVASVLASPALLTIAAMFVISGALVRTGTLEWVAGFVTKRAESRPVVAIALILGGTLVASAFVNNMPVVLVLIPVVLRLAATAKIAPTRLLIPLSYAAVLGGTCTLIGTSTNLVVAGVAVEQGLEPFTIFEITPIGIAASIAGLATMGLLARFILPARGDASGDLDADDRSAFLSEVTITADYAGLGDTVGAHKLFKPEGIALQALVRGGEQIRHDFDDHVLQAGDRFVIAATREEILSLSGIEGIHVGKDRGGFSDDAVVVETFLAPGRRGLRERLARLPLLHGRDIAILGVNRDRHLAGRSLNDIMLRPADRLMVRAEPDAVARLSRSPIFVSLTRTEQRPFRRDRAPIAIGAAAAVVVLAALGVAPIGALALIAVAALLVLRCIDAEEAWSAIDGSLLVLIFGMLVIGLGLQQSGAIDIILSAVGSWFVAAPPFLFIIALYALTSVMTELVTNNAVAVIVTPIAVALAVQAGIDPRAAVVAVMAAASASFATPVGYQTNTLVYGAGDYRFADFLKIGIPMNITVGLASSAVIYWLWL